MGVVRNNLRSMHAQGKACFVCRMAKDSFSSSEESEYETQSINIIPPTPRRVSRPRKLPAHLVESMIIDRPNKPTEGMM